MELLTHTELSQKLKDGWTSVILVTGGTEERGPQDVLGGHTMMAHSHAGMIAKKLGKTLVAPVLPIAVNATGLNANREMADQPGAMQMPAEVFKQVQLAEIDSLARSGFKDIYVMGDHGGGQAEMKDAAEEMDKKWTAKGTRVYYVSDFYNKTHDDVDMYLYEHKLPIGGHGAMLETSIMLYLEPSPGRVGAADRTRRCRSIRPARRRSSGRPRATRGWRGRRRSPPVRRRPPAAGRRRRTRRGRSERAAAREQRRHRRSATVDQGDRQGSHRHHRQQRRQRDQEDDRRAPRRRRVEVMPFAARRRITPPGPLAFPTIDVPYNERRKFSRCCFCVSLELLERVDDAVRFRAGARVRADRGRCRFDVRPSCRKKMRWPSPHSGARAELTRTGLALADAVGESDAHVVHQQIGEQVRPACSAAPRSPRCRS